MSRRGLLLFGVMCVIWGIPYLLIRVSVRELSPAFLVFARTGFAALLLLPLAARRGELRVLLPHWRPLVLFAVGGDRGAMAAAVACRATADQLADRADDRRRATRRRRHDGCGAAAPIGSMAAIGSGCWSASWASRRWSGSTSVAWGSSR